MRSLVEKKIIISIASFAALSVIIVMAIIVPTIKYIKELDRETYNLRIALEKKNERVMSYRRANEQIEKIKKDAPQFENYLFLPGQELKLITTLEAIATKDGMTQKINNSNIDKITNQKIQLSLTIIGPFEKAVKYLNDLEQLPYFINVNKLSISPQTDRSNPNSDQVSMNLDLSLYVSP